jgi:NAD(P)-dependent dehydrogenase (short-subunit alcohol dehydrogenase family)
MGLVREEFSGLTAVVTGSGSGIGLEVARQLHGGGAHVVGLDLEVGALGELGEFIECDISSDASVTRAADRAKKSLGGSLNVLINNAGIGAIGTILDASPEEWEKVFGVNVFGTARVVREFYPLLKAGSHPVIVNTCSVASPVGLPQRAVYSASKGALESLTRAMAADFLPDGIRVNGVNPGTADTPWVQRLLDQADDPVAQRKALEARQPIGRLVSAEEVAHAILYLAQPQSLSTTGTILAVDGGLASLRVPPATN